jgi:hypothetical protein
MMAGASKSELPWIQRMQRVHWAKLDYAYGHATDVTDLIQTIAFGDEAEALDACGILNEELVHQGSIYSSTYEAIPFLVEVLADTRPGSKVRVHVLALLEGIADACVHSLQLAHSEGKDPRPQLGRFFDRLWLGTRLFAGLMRDDPAGDVRMGAAYLLGMLLSAGPGFAAANGSEGYAAAVKMLVASLRRPETDELAASSAVFALGRAAVHDATLIEHLRRAGKRTVPGESTRVASALAIVEIDSGRHAQLGEVDLLVGTMQRAEQTDALFHLRTGEDGERRSPWVTARLRFQLQKALCAWSIGDQDRMERVLPAFLACIRLTSGYVAATDLGPIFHWLWPTRQTLPVRIGGGRIEYAGPPPMTPSDLTPVARRVLQTCYETPKIWEPRVGNTSWAFRNVGLPETRDGLKDLLERTT